MKTWLHDLRDAVFDYRGVHTNQKRVKRAVVKLDIDYIYWAMKPFTWGIDRSARFFIRNEVVMVGRPAWSDIRQRIVAGIRSILVKNRWSSTTLSRLRSIMRGTPCAQENH